MEEKVQGIVRVEGAMKGKEIRSTFHKFIGLNRLTSKRDFRENECSNSEPIIH